MTIGPVEHLLCPRCGHPFARRTILSTNTFGARIWSDGFVCGPMTATPPVVALCPECAGWFWLDDGCTVDEDSLSALPTPIETWSELPPSDYQEVLRSGQYRRHGPEHPAPNDGRRELIVRMRLWWVMNTEAGARRPDRESAGTSAAITSQAFGDNLERVIALLSRPSSLDEGMAVAEAYRELGRFDESIPLYSALIEEWSREMGFDWVVDRSRILRREALEGNPRVVDLTPPRPQVEDGELDESIPHTIDDL